MRVELKEKTEKRQGNGFNGQSGKKSGKSSERKEEGRDSFSCAPETLLDGWLHCPPETRLTVWTEQTSKLLYGHTWVYDTLSRKMKSYADRRTAIAFTGELGSRILLNAAAKLPKELGSSFVAITANGHLRSRAEAERAKKEAAALGIDHYIFEIDELNYGGVRKNASDRCYHCRRYLFQKIQRLCHALGVETILCGVSTESCNDPMVQSLLEEFQIKAPLAELGFSSTERRRLARELGILLPASSHGICFATRFPEKTILTREKIQQVEQAEHYLHSMNFRDVRLMVYGSEVQIMAEERAVSQIIACRMEIVEYLKGLGYHKIMLNLEDF